MIFYFPIKLVLLMFWIYYNLYVILLSIGYKTDFFGVFMQFELRWYNLKFIILFDDLFLFFHICFASTHLMSYLSLMSLSLFCLSYLTLHLTGTSVIYYLILFVLDFFHLPRWPKHFSWYFGRFYSQFFLDRFVAYLNF